MYFSRTSKNAAHRSALFWTHVNPNAVVKFTDDLHSTSPDLDSIHGFLSYRLRVVEPFENRLGVLLVEG
jgi:hypothetical protein